MHNSRKYFDVKKNKISIWFSEICVECTTRIYLVLLFFTTTSQLFLVAQTPNIGTPPIFHYERNIYHGGTQSWESDILDNGNMVFANNDGLLEFNGVEWRTYRLPKKTICRSLAVAQNSRIYVGGQDEVGYFSNNTIGELVYTSIRERIKKRDLPLADVWDFVIHDGISYFRSADKVFVDNQQDSIYVIASFPELTKLSLINGIIYIAVQNQGLYKIDQEIISRCTGTTTTDITFTAMCQSPQGILLSSLKNGLFLYAHDSIQQVSLKYQEFLSDNRIMDIYRTGQDQIVIATERNGIVITNSALEPIYHINKSVGLQHNTVLALQEDHAGSMWLATANGIDQVLLQAGTQIFYPDGEEEGSIYDILEHKGFYYFATGNGLYYLEKQVHYDPFEKRDFQLVRNSLGQVWGLDIIDGELLMGHNDGAFHIKGGEAYPISPKRYGSWKFAEVGEGLMVTGTYFGLDFYKKEGERFIFLESSTNFTESSRIIEIDNQNNIWVSHPYRGVYKITLEENFNLTIQEYGQNRGLTSENQNYVFQFHDHIIVTNDQGIFQYDAELDRFNEKSEWLEYLTPNTSVSRLFPLDENQLLYTTDTHIGRFIYSSQIGEAAIFHQSWTQHAEALVNGFEYIYPTNESTFFLASDKGVILHSLENSTTDHTIKAYFNEIRFVSDSTVTLFAGHGTPSEKVILEPFQNKIQLNYSSNLMNPSQPTEFRYWLEGIEERWSDWSSGFHKEYTGLRHGNYTFYLQSRNVTHGESPIVEFSFTIKPYWYQSKLAYIIYGLLSLAAMLAFLGFLRKRYRKEATVLKEEQKLSQAEIERLKNEKLETELQFRNKELASSTMHLVQKNETISKIRQEVESIQGKIKDPKIRRELRKVVTVINDDNRLEDDWENFAIYFDQVHTNFLKRLRKQYSELSSKDLKLAAYLRMNLTTKEIAPLLNISIRGVEISRYRLRKKLDLDSDINLNEYMMNF